jgi:hypothetical protein
VRPVLAAIVLTDCNSRLATAIFCLSLPAPNQDLALASSAGFLAKRSIAVWAQVEDTGLY